MLYYLLHKKARSILNRLSGFHKINYRSGRMPEPVFQEKWFFSFRHFNQFAV